MSFAEQHRADGVGGHRVTTTNDIPTTLDLVGKDRDESSLDTVRMADQATPSALTTGD